MVQTIKGALKKAKSSKSDPELALLCLRTTPIDNALPSPAVLLNKRKMRDTLPVIIRSDDTQHSTVHERLVEKQEIQKLYHDRHGVKELSSLLSGQSVQIRDHQTGKWSPATVQRKCEEPRSYMITTPSGHTLRRNRCHIRDTEPVKKQVRFEDELDKTNPRSVDTDAKVTKHNGVTPPPNTVTPDCEVIKEPQPSEQKTRSGRVIRKPNRLVDEV